MPTFNYDGFKIAFEQRGRKQDAAERPTVLIHGLPLPRKHRFPPNRLSDVICDFLDEVWL